MFCDVVHGRYEELLWGNSVPQTFPSPVSSAFASFGVPRWVCCCLCFWGMDGKLCEGETWVIVAVPLCFFPFFSQTEQQGKAELRKLRRGVFLDLSNALLASRVPIRAGPGGGFVSGFVLVQKGNAPGGPEWGWPTEAIKDENWSLSVATGRSLE